MSAFVIYSFNMAGFDWNRYAPSRSTITSYLNPYEYSWNTYAKVVAAGLGFATMWQLFNKQQQLAKMKSDSLQKIISIRRIIEDTANGANFWGDLGIIENAIQVAADENRMIRLQYKLEELEKEYKEQLIERIKQKNIPTDSNLTVDYSLEQLGNIYKERYGIHTK